MTDPDPLKTLTYALEHHAGQVEVVNLRRLVTESARQNRKRPAYVKLALPDEVVQSVRGRPDAGDTVLVVRIPKDVADRQDSNIILPGDIR